MVWQAGGKIMSNNIEGKVVVITDASSCLDEAVARHHIRIEGRIL